MTTALHVGETVRLNAPPFADLFPGDWLVDGFDDAGNATIDGGKAFDDAFFDLVEAAQGGGSPPVVPVRITQYAFEDRFTTAELIAADMASLHNSALPNDDQANVIAATLRVYRRKLDAANFIDLTLAETIAGVQSLEAIGLIAQGRAAEILSSTIQPGEAA